MGKKRLLINIILTILCLIILHSVYINVQPLKLSFDVEMKDDVKDRVLLNVAYQKEFRKVFKNKYSTTFSLNGDKSLGLDFPVLYIHKLRISLANSGDSSLILSNFRVDGVADNSVFSSANLLVDDCEVKDLGNGKIQIFPKDDECNFSTKTIRFVAPIKFDYKLMLIIATCVFFSLFKLLNYLADFKYTHKYSRINIIFVTVCFALLFVPMLKINKESISKNEKRVLTPFAGLLIDGKINKDFGKNFESYFNDRFFGREDLINNYNELKQLVDGNLSRNIRGKDGWRFYNSKDFNGYADYQNRDSYSTQDLAQIARYLVAFDEYCKANNKKFYYVIWPNKNRVYGEFFDDNVIKIHPDSENKTWQLINYLRANTSVKVIYPLNELMEAKKNHIIYQKLDTHWTHLGAYYGYLALANEVKKDVDFEILPLLGIESKPFGSKGDLLDIGEKNVPNYEYMEPIFPPNPDLKISEDTLDIYAPNGTIHVMAENPKKKLKMVVYRDSFSSFLPAFFGNGFKTVELNWRYNVVKSDFENLKDADVVILAQVERFVELLLKYEFPKEQ